MIGPQPLAFISMLQPVGQVLGAGKNACRFCLRGGNVAQAGLVAGVAVGAGVAAGAAASFKGKKGRKGGEEAAAVQLQKMYRGYRVRKSEGKVEQQLQATDKGHTESNKYGAATTAAMGRERSHENGALRSIANGAMPRIKERMDSLQV